MRLSIVQYPNEILTQVSKPVELIHGKLSEHDYTIAYDLTDTLKQMNDEGRAIGLSAPQVGHSVRILAMMVYNQYTMINPEIVKISDIERTAEEGCLSFPNLGVKVSRPNIVKVRYFDMRGTMHTIKLFGLEARCFQHELDHLDGILMIDKEIK